MVLKQILEILDILDNPKVKALEVKKLFNERGCQSISVESVEGEHGEVEFIKIILAGLNGKIKGGNSPTINIVGQLGGIGAYPIMTGFVSDGDGALAALSAALKIVEMQSRECYLEGDVVVTTHICNTAPITPRKLVTFLDMPLPVDVLLKYLVDSQADAVLSIDTTKGNRILNQRGFAITPTVKEGYILKVSDDLLDIMSTVTGLLPAVIAISTQDITSYNNNLYHINSIMQPVTFTDSPVVGVAITAQTPVAGSATGATNFVDIEMAARFCIEVAKYYGAGKCKLFDNQEFEKLVSMYGSMKHLQKT
ncbi:MAG: DUF1177 domain-containing protein [Bacteroidales bacterium]|nr:DUF1177 domain-containing protein [Bacteroidales bacterium]